MNKSKLKMQAFAADVISHRPLQVASAEIKTAGNTVQANWVLSGLDRNENLAPLLEVTVPVSASSATEAERKCLRFASDFLFPLVDEAELSEGLTRTNVSLTAEARREICLSHMEVHSLAEVGTFTTWKDETVKTAKLYLFAKLMGVASASDLVARFLNLPVATIHKRIVRAKEQGLVDSWRPENRA